MPPGGSTESGQDTRRGVPVVLIIGTAALIALIGLLYWASQYAPPPAVPHELPLTMGPAEDDYVAHIEFLEPNVARAANFLNQEVTFVFGTVRNNGPQAIRQIEVTLEFHDVFGQVVLRDKVRIFSPDAIPLESYHTRDFQVTYETLPVQWNQAYPSLRVSGLALQ
jgi:hypothetical protein